MHNDGTHKYELYYINSIILLRLYDAHSVGSLQALTVSFYNIHVVKTQSLNACIDCHVCTSMLLKSFNSLWLNLCMHLVKGQTLLLAPVVEYAQCSCWYS